MQARWPRWGAWLVAVVLVALDLPGGCVIHAGVAPPVARYGAVGMSGAVAEPGLVEEVGAAISASLARSGAWEAGSDAALAVDVVSADLEPWRRGDGGVLYRARLVVRAQGGTETRSFTVEREVPDPGSAAGAVGARAAVFRDLAGEAGERVAAWVGASGASAP